MTERFDIVVIGAGAGGLTVAAEAKKQGAKIALVSNGLPGGDCSYYGCLPTKTLIHSAKSSITCAGPRNSDYQRLTSNPISRR